MNTGNYISYIIFSILLFCFSSCVERIDINTEASPPRLVIYGYITTDTAQHAIRITRSSGYFVSTKPEAVPHAKVSISYDDGVIELNESSEEPGLYLTSPGVYGIAGKTYTLHTSLDFNGDGEKEEYEAASFLPFPAILDAVAVTTASFSDEFLQVFISGRIPEESSNNFSFHLFHNGVILNDSLQGFIIFQDDYIKSKEFSDMPLLLLSKEREKYQFSSGDTITVQVESLTPEYATFIENAQQESFGSLPLFSGPPANVETNIRCLSSGSTIGISGFFTAYSKNSAYTIYK